ncbi:lipopolysaccharide biosynthesis protein [Tannockella kyphosi]|uniref:lipopolysaccharide biosynthesis protein n=1 Tax=Tannockella kyphosi TaxID=2899121 RepID=UPI002011610E|nr:polysaccharide biosynthesis C-terminal domain-containing protein [Tannockella kyphosi]
MSREASLAKNTMILALGTFLPRIISLLTTPIITAYTQGDGYGYISLLTTTVLSFVVPLATLQLEQAFFRFLINARNDHEKSVIISSGIFIVFGVMLLVSLGCMILPFIDLTGFWLFLLILYIWIEVFCQIMRFILRSFAMYKEYSFLAAMVVVVNFVILCVCLIVFEIGYMGVLIALTLADIVGICYSTYKTQIFKYIHIKNFEFNQAKEMLFYACPFIPNAVAWYINQMSDQWIITLFLGLTSNGIYIIATKVPAILNLIYPAFNLAWTESATRSVEDSDSDDYYGRMFKVIYCLLSAGTAGLVAISPFLFAFFNQNPELDAGFIYTPILVIGACFSCFAQFFSSIYVALKEGKNMMVTTVTAAFLNVVLNLLFVKKFGIIAAVFATVISNATLAGYRYYDINKRYCALKIPRRMILFTVFVFLLTVVLSLQGVLWINVVNVCISVIFAYVVAGDIVKIMLMSIVKKIKR